jgi:hypothetical protein
VSRPGRPSPEKERRIKDVILNLLPVEPPGIRFKQIIEGARAQGISKPAVWRHLKRFVDLTVVLHEGTQYRKNPVYNIDTPGVAFTFEHTGILDLTAQKTYGSLRKLVGVDYWDERTESFLSGVDLGNRKIFANILEVLLRSITASYFLTLVSLLQAPNLAAAREIAALRLDSDIRNELMMVARSFWEQRARTQQVLPEVSNIHVTLRPIPKREIAEGRKMVKAMIERTKKQASTRTRP